MAIVHNGLPTNGFNGSVLTGRKVSPLIGNVHTELNTLLNAYGGETSRMQFGLLKQWYQYKIVNTPLLSETELNGHIIETPHAGAIIDFWIPFSTGGAVILDHQLDGTVQKPGYGGTKFPVIFSHQFAPGVTLTDRLFGGEQIQVDPDEEVVAGGGGYITYIRVPGGMDLNAWISRDVLGPDRYWVKVGHHTGEHDVQTDYLSDPFQTGLAKYSYVTGSSEIHIKHWITAQADRASVDPGYSGTWSGKSGIRGFSEEYNKTNLNTVSSYFNYVLGQDGSKKIDPKSVHWMPTIIELMLKELALMKERSMMWMKGYEQRDMAGKVFKVPSGYYHWIKNYGTYEEYSDLKELKNIMDNLMTKLFAGRGDLHWSKRRIKWRAGLGALNELQNQFMTQLQRSNPFLLVNDGRNPILQGMITGPYDALSFKQPRVLSFEYPNLGTVEIEHEPALDFIDSNNPSNTLVNGLSETSYMIFIEDITADSFTNAFNNKGHVQAIGTTDYNNGPNVVQLKPKNFIDELGFFAGVGASPTLKKFASSNLLSTERRGFGVQGWTTGEIFVKDASRIALIEYKPDKIFNWY